MSSDKTTLLTHIFNEEYLLPFWLEHHKNMFDELIVIDYHSTDKSLKLCQTIWPGCKMITTRNKCFDAEEIDNEVMDIENGIEGIKLVLNTTEFLFCNIPIKEIFANSTHPISYSITAVSPYSCKQYDITNIFELFHNLLNTDVVYHNDRGARHIHTYRNGNYNPGRHITNNYSKLTYNAHIVWFGYYPMNDNLLKRKLQIQQNIPERDKSRGFGFQHLFDRNQILSVNNHKSMYGIPLKTINESLYEIITSNYTKPK